MQTLLSDPRYETEILWCDIGYASAFPSIGSLFPFRDRLNHTDTKAFSGGDWYNFAASQGRQVVRDDRCGSNMTDYVTPEYATYPSRLVSFITLAADSHFSKSPFPSRRNGRVVKVWIHSVMDTTPTRKRVSCSPPIVF